MRRPFCGVTFCGVILFNVPSACAWPAAQSTTVHTIMMATHAEQVQLRKTRDAEKMRNWRAAQTAEAKESRRQARQLKRLVDQEREARKQRFARHSPEAQEEHRRRDRRRHKVLRLLRKEWDLLAAEEARAVAAEARADKAGSKAEDAEQASNSVEVSEEIELSGDFMRAGLKDRSDLFGPRPTVPLTKRARLLSYVNARVFAIK